MKTISVLAGIGIALSSVSCETTDSSGDDPEGYQDPYAGYGGGYGASSDYVQVTPSGETGADPYGGYAGDGGVVADYGSAPQVAPTTPVPQPTYTSSPAPVARTYTIQKGDTLYRISKMHGVTVEAIMSANSLTSTTIFPGDVITIP